MHQSYSISQLSWVSTKTRTTSSLPFSPSFSSSPPLSLPLPPPMKSNPKPSRPPPLTRPRPSSECSTSRTPTHSSWTKKKTSWARRRRGSAEGESQWERRRRTTGKPGLSQWCFQRVLSLPQVHLLATMNTPHPSPTASSPPQNHRVSYIISLHLISLYLSWYSCLDDDDDLVTKGNTGTTDLSQNNHYRCSFFECNSCILHFIEMIIFFFSHNFLLKRIR